MMKWIRTSRLSIKKTLSQGCDVGIEGGGGGGGARDRFTEGCGEAWGRAVWEVQNSRREENTDTSGVALLSTEAMPEQGRSP